ncbi:predicted protein [Thalassiosira pseudonana CCMP1335]|uniref:Lon N-terminal domain-containing protein n=1 Tax=Thalassiosira pseudonana TaxID=35128 RepID=B5YMP2_THAPS|nr:predicted protein [Thalassiosira pseudonana CCMP1335]ACI64496.1 predicted protein [Thalassiosira pseudonana CCMP1335]
METSQAFLSPSSVLRIGAMLLAVSTPTSASHLSHPPPCFVSSSVTRRHGNGSSREASAQSINGARALLRSPAIQSSPLLQPRALRLSMFLSNSDNDDMGEVNNHDDEGEDEIHDISDFFDDEEQTQEPDESAEVDDDDDDIEEDEYDDIKSNLSKVAWLPSVRKGKQPYRPPAWRASTSRRENIEQDGYESVEDASSGTPPGYRNVEILPVLPMSMVHGLKGKMFLGEEVTEEEGSDGISLTSALGPIFSGTSGYLPYTKGHVLTIAEPRYKKLYDDLLQLGTYFGKKRDGAMKRAKEKGADAKISNLPDPDEKRRFIVTVANPNEDGVFAEYGVIFQLRDLDEVAAIASYDMDDGLTMEELNDLVDPREFGYEDSIGEDFLDVLLETHYEATHDVVGRVKIHRFVNPECWDDGPDGEEYLMAEATILDVVENDRSKMIEDRKNRGAQAGEEVEVQQAPLTTGRKIEERAKQQAIGDVANAVARIKEELRSAVGETFKQQQIMKEESRTAGSSIHQDSGKYSDNDSSSKSNRSKSSIPLVPKGILVERRADGSLLKEERALRESFAQLVSLQQELKEKFRFTRESVKSFGIGSVGMWLSAAAWSKFVEKRLEATNGEMQSDFQAKLVEYMSGRNEDEDDIETVESYLGKQYEEDNDDDDSEMEGDTIDFDDLSPELQQEFQLVQARATDELGPLAFERAIHMQRIVQAESYIERLNLLRECVDSERKRLEAKKMLRLAFNNYKSEGGDGTNPSRLSSREARSVFERLMEKDRADDGVGVQNEDAFQ